MKFIVFAALLAAATAASIKMAPLVGLDHPDVVSGEYVVVFHKNISADTVDRHHAFLAQKYSDEDVSVKFKYSYAIKGYSAKMNDRVRDTVRLMPEVHYVNTNQKIELNQGQDCGIFPVESWGVPRTVTRGRPENYNDYLLDLNCGGTGTNVYVIDTGIDEENTYQYFDGRVEFGADFVEGYSYPVDPNGHGTHVAGTVGGFYFGLAFGATIHSVRVLNAGGSGTFDAVVRGVDHVTGDRNRARRIINMSLGGGYYQPLIDAIEGAFVEGVHPVVAAGNEASDACNRSPAAAEYAITVGATDINDARASFSNYGNCVEVYAPGVNIRAPYRGGEPADLSGTSMASPHVAGVVSKMLTNEGCRGGVSESPGAVRDYLLSTATEGIITGIPFGDNLFLHMGCEG